MALEWPTSRQVNTAVGARVRSLLDQYDGAVGDLGRRVLSEDAHILADNAHSMTAVVVAGTCLSAGSDWHIALWPAAAAECLMAAADILDDVADLDPGSAAHTEGGVLLTGAAGLLALSGLATLRAVEDGVDSETALALGQLLGAGFAHAANGQAASLVELGTDPATAYRHSAAKSGPLGSLIAQLGARCATEHDELLALYGRFGASLAIRSQLMNDARDASPGRGALKADVRTGARTVPLTFTGSRGAPPGLSEFDLAAWDAQERQRIASNGGIAAAHALAEAARLRAGAALDTLAARNCQVGGLRALLD
jgi:geranylgeranyl pyrophosphate synthase